MEREIEKLLLRKEEKLEIKWKDEENTCLEEVGGKEGPAGDRILHLDRSLALEMDFDWEVNEQQQSFHSSQDAASQTDLFASELGRLKQAMEDVSLEERHSFAIEEDDCALNVHLEEGEGQEEVLENTGNVENVDVMERSIQEELKASLLPDNVESMKEKEKRSGMLRSPICDKSIIIVSMEEEEEEDLALEGEVGLSSVDCAVNTETEEKISTKSGSIKNLLAWLLLLLALFTTFGAFRVDHKVHLPSTWLLLYHLFGSSLPLPVISVEYDSNPRPHIN